MLGCTCGGGECAAPPGQQHAGSSGTCALRSQVIRSILLLCPASSSHCLPAFPVRPAACLPSLPAGLPDAVFAAAVPNNYERPVRELVQGAWARSCHC